VVIESIAAVRRQQWEAADPARRRADIADRFDTIILSVEFAPQTGKL
jgi:hypothetical protein